ncbi:MAG: hypothetical protein ACOYVD_02460 [Bacillota bacterium]
MKILINSVGDPWRDWGIIAVYKMLKTFRRYLISPPEITTNYLNAEFKPNISEEKIQEEITEYLKSLLNKIVLRDFSMKALGLERKKDDNHIYDLGYSVTLTKEEAAEVQKITGRRPDNGKAGVTLKRNYVGIAPDLKKAMNELSGLTEAFIAQVAGELKEKEKTYCPVCSLPYSKKMGVAMRQNKNPFYNQHHNNKVRGHANSVETIDMCPVCNFLNSFTAYSANMPYFIGDSTHILLPEVNDLLILEKVYDRITTGLLDVESSTLYSYNTNIPELRHRSLYPTLITLYFCIKYKYSAETGEFEEFDWDKAIEKYLHRWQIIRYNKGQNVIFNVFSTVDVPHRLLDLVEKLEFGKEGAKKGNIVQNFLQGWFSNDKRSIDTLARGIVLKDWDLVSKSLYQHYKDDGKMSFDSINFFGKFTTNAFGEVDKLLSPELMEDIKIIGRYMSYILKDDIGLFTNLSNAYNKDSLRKVISQVFFKMSKIKQTINFQKLKDFPIEPAEARIERLLNALNNERDFTNIKDTLIIFSSLSALKTIRKKEEDEV